MSRARFELRAEHSRDWIAVLSREHRVLYLNRPSRGGGAPWVRVGEPAEQMTDPEWEPRAREAIEQVFESGVPAEYEASFAEGSRQCRVRALPLPTEHGEPRALLILTEITEQRREPRAWERFGTQVNQTQRLESLGLLVGSIAHDFNNLLQVVMSNLEFAQEQASSGADPSHDLEQAMYAAEQASVLTSQLLAFVREQEPRREPADLCEITARVVSMLRRTIPASIEIELRYDAHERCVARVDVAQVEQVLLNLSLNARDAMPAGGKLQIEVWAPSEEQVELRVRDSGEGIANEALAHIFEPFYSSKPPGLGSGLGLAVVDGIVQRHSGTVEVRSERGAGSEFVVRFPRSRDDQPTAELGERCSAGEPQTVLVAEDEPQVRDLVVRTLQRAGYRVLQARDGVDAVQQFRESARPVDLVLLDAVMPRMNGWPAYQQIAAAAPGARVLFTSAYSASALPAGALTRSLGVLHKPYQSADLLSAVRRALDRPV